MGRIGKRLLSAILVICFFFSAAEPVRAAQQPVSVSAPSAILIEASTGKVITQINATERRSPASITKIMTLLLIFDALKEGRITLQQEVMTSAYAKSMGGSQVFLEEGEIQTVDTLIKCITVASGNDASVAMAECIAGSEEAFVEQMNQRAKGLGMQDTHFEDCCGLTDSEGHYTTAKDVALMSRELITKYPQVLEYSGIWMEDIVHNTAQGSNTFTLSSTNKLLKQYDWITGLKTGSTSKAKYCISATGKKDDIELIAVVMGAPDPKQRFADAAKLLSYGYSICALYTDENKDTLPEMTVKGGVEDKVALRYEGPFRYLDTGGNNLEGITKEISLPEFAAAPVKEGEAAGAAVYKLNGEIIGNAPILFGASIDKAAYKDYLKRVWKSYLL